MSPGRDDVSMSSRTAYDCDGCGGRDVSRVGVSRRVGVMVGRDGKEREVYDDFDLCTTCARLALDEFISGLSHEAWDAWRRGHRRFRNGKWKWSS